MGGRGIREVIPALDRAVSRGSATLAVLSDVHGNLPALRSVLAEIRNHHPHALVAAGDYLGGPHPNETIELLREHDALMILGNWDLSVLALAAGEAPASWSTARQFAPLRWSLEELGPDPLRFLRTLPEQLSLAPTGAPALRVVHGSPDDPSESLLPVGSERRLAAIAGEIAEGVLVCGHIHEPWKKVVNGVQFINPGAVSAPLYGDPRASYATLRLEGSSWYAEHHSVIYDLAAIRRDYHETGFLERGGAFARAFLLSCQTGERVGEAFRDHAAQLAERAGVAGLDYFPDGIWEEAERTFRWPSVPEGGMEVENRRGRRRRPHE